MFFGSSAFLIPATHMVGIVIFRTKDVQQPSTECRSSLGFERDLYLVGQEVFVP